MRLSEELQREMDCTDIPKFLLNGYPYSADPDIFRVSLEVDNDTDNDKKTPVIDNTFGPPGIFPLTALYHTRELPNDRLNPRYADRWPIGFDNTQWPTIWAGKTLHLDKFLQEYRLAYRTTYITAIEERNYRGTPWRLRVDEVKASKGMPILRHGMIVSYLHSNTKHLRYIVDHCIFRDLTIAYLKVYCFNLDQDVCDSESTRPPFLLAVPIDYCQVRDYPDSLPATPSSFISPFHPPEPNSYPPPKSHFSEDGEKRSGVVAWIRCLLPKMPCY
jgi:hypothetical protein